MQPSPSKSDILKTLLTALSFALLLNLVSYYAWAAIPEGRKLEASAGAEQRRSATESKNVAETLMQNQTQLAEQEEKRRKVLSAVYELNRKMQGIEASRGRLSQEQQQLEASIRSLAQKIEELSKKSGQQRALLFERLRAIYKLRAGNLARMIFSSNSATELERNLKIMGLVAERDLELIRDYKDTLGEIIKRKEKLTQRLAHLKGLDQKIAKKEEQLASEQRTKSQILAGIKRTNLFTLNQIKELRERAKDQMASSDKSLSEDSGALDLLFRESFAEKKGQLPAPVLGPVLVKYGVQKFPDRHYTVSSKGVLIAAPSGSSVKAVFDGKVAFVGELSGFGQTLIIDHGDHYYTVYGNASMPKVQIGDEVKQMQSIAQVGQLEQLQGYQKTEANEGIYFEVRHFSEPNDPLKWVKGIN